jgi:hypothetical protein
VRDLFFAAGAGTSVHTRRERVALLQPVATTGKPETDTLTQKQLCWEYYIVRFNLSAQLINHDTMCFLTTK